MSRRFVPAVVLVAAAIGASSARARGLNVMPFPGTPDASPTSQIIFSTLRPADIAAVTVVGSRSGVHTGHLSKLPDGAGTAFVPSHRFTSGERVSVAAVLGSAAADAAAGAPGATTLRFSFRVQRSPDLVARRRSGAARGSGAIGLFAAPRASAEPGLSFRSNARLHPPPFTVSHDPDPGSGSIFLSPTGHIQQGPMILNARGQLVWFHPLQGNLVALNLEVQHYRGRPVLTWFRGTPSGGVDLIMDRSYRTVATVRAGNGYSADMHEFALTRRGTAWLDAYVPVHADLRSVHGPENGAAYDCVIQEVDIRTGRVLWEWHSLGHVPLTDSHSPYAKSNLFGVYDYFHLNSIQQLSGGNLLISARNTWGVYEISRRTGRVIWTLGGKHPSFTMGPGTNFEWQHDARLHPGGLLTVFDDAGTPWEEPQSSAKELRLDLSAHRVSLVRRFVHSPYLRSGSQGSAQVLPGGDVFVGWGSEPYFSQYTPSGRQLFSGHFALGVKSYRAYRFPWIGRPSTRPSLAVRQRSNRRVTVYVSWNGATQVAAWRVLGGPTKAALRPLRARVPWSNFETAVSLRTTSRYLAVQALDAGGQVLRTSGTVARP